MTPRFKEGPIPRDRLRELTRQTLEACAAEQWEAQAPEQMLGYAQALMHGLATAPEAAPFVRLALAAIDDNEVPEKAAEGAQLAEVLDRHFGEPANAGRREAWESVKRALGSMFEVARGERRYDIKQSGYSELRLLGGMKYQVIHHAGVSIDPKAEILAAARAELGLKESDSLDLATLLGVSLQERRTKGGKVLAKETYEADLSDGWQLLVRGAGGLIGPGGVISFHPDEASIAAGPDTIGETAANLLGVVDRQMALSAVAQDAMEILTGGAQKPVLPGQTIADMEINADIDANGAPARYRITTDLVIGNTTPYGGDAAGMMTALQLVTTAAADAMRQASQGVVANVHYRAISADLPAGPDGTSPGAVQLNTLAVRVDHPISEGATAAQVASSVNRVLAAGRKAADRAMKEPRTPAAPASATAATSVLDRNMQARFGVRGPSAASPETGPGF